MELYFALSGFISAVASTILGGFIYFKNKKEKANQVFALFCLSVTVWGLFYMGWPLSQSQEGVLFWFRMLHIGAIFISTTYFHFIIIWLNLYQEKKKILFLGYGLSFFFLFFIFSPLFIKDVVPKFSMQYWAEPGILYHFYLLMFFGYALYAFYLLYKNYKKLMGIKKEQMRYVLVGVIIGYLGGSTNYFLWYDINFPPYGNMLVSVYVIFTAYVILKYRFLDIRVALSRGFVYLLSFLSVILLGFSAVIATEIVFPDVSQNILMILAIVLGIFLFRHIFDFFQNIASKYFHYTFYNYQKVLSNLGREITRILDINKLSSQIADTLTETMKLDRAVILIKKEEEGRYVIQKNIGFKEENGISLVKDNFLTEYLEKNQKPLVYEELSLIAKDIHSKEEKRRIKSLQENMKRIEPSLCLPLLVKDEISGMIVLGSKISGDPYFEQDIDLLMGLSNQASIALYNARLYSEVQDLSQNLEKKVEEQVKELKMAYRKLQRLDKVKTEFMSIVSHQLRTPLSIIKGQLSMVREGVYEEDKDKERKVLQNVYDANERLIALVNDVLNISRIQSGRVDLGKERVDLVEVTRNTTERMRPSLNGKKVELIFEEPLEKLPEIEIDISKIENVIINLIDNAVKYTEDGEVRVSVEKEEDSLKVSIKDTGEGMNKEEIEKLFDTFSRGGAGKKHWIQGSGLGLYIARQFVEMHKGKVWAESEGEGRGSQLYITIPLPS